MSFKLVDMTAVIHTFTNKTHLFYIRLVSVFIKPSSGNCKNKYINAKHYIALTAINK